MSKAGDVLAACRAKGLSIACAESCTGGMLAAALTDVAGASDVFDRGFVTYSNVAKIDMLGVLDDTLQAHGAVSEQVAKQMAEGALAHSNASLAIAITGIAGPGPSGHKPEGRVCFGLAKTGQTTQVETIEFGAMGRAKLRKGARDHALDLLLAAATKA